MKKKAKLKTLAVSALIALATLGVGAGGTFALFTDSAETKVNVTAGTVDIESAVKIIAAASLNAEDATAVENEGQSATYVNGGSAVVGTTGTVTLSNWTPGDTVTLDASPTNNSNVKIKTRLKVVMTGDLASALVVEVFDKDDNSELKMGGQRTVVTDWLDINAGGDIDKHSLKISFPDHDGGEVLFGSDNKDNQYQGKEATIKIFYEAVQSNASVTVDPLRDINLTLAEQEAVDGEQNHTMYDALQDLSADQITSIRDNKYVWSQESDEFFAFTSEPTDAYKYFKMYQSASEVSGDYSIFADASTWDATVALDGKGFDAGDATGIETINYTNTTGTARNVVIRTNTYMTTLTVDAATDEVAHYDKAKNVEIIRVKQGTYNEYGDILGNIKLAQGNVNIASGGKASDVHIAPLKDATDNVVTPTASTVAVSIEDGAELNTVTNMTENVSINATGAGASNVHSVTPVADAIAYTEDGQITTLAELGKALQGTKKVTLLANVDLADESVLGCDGLHRNCLTNPIKVTADFDLNGYTAYVLHMGFVVDEDNVKISNGTIYTCKTTYGSGVSSSRPTAEQIANNQAITGYSKTQYDRYGVVIQGDNVELAGLKVYGGISLGGDKGSDVSYTPVNKKGTNSAYNTKVIGCDLIALNASSRKSIYAQSGSNGAEIIDTILTGGTANTAGLLFIVGGLGDMGSAGDVNGLSFKNVKCNVNPLTDTSYKIGGVTQFTITGDVNGIRTVEAQTEYAASSVTITKTGDFWYLNGSLTYKIH